MIRILHRMLDLAATAGNVSVTAHPAAALAHLGQPRAPRRNGRDRAPSATTRPAPAEHPATDAPERLTWLSWSGGTGRRRAISVEGTFLIEKS